MDKVADVEINPSSNHVDHENTVGKSDITANVSGHDLGSVASEVEDGVAAITFPQEYNLEVSASTPNDKPRPPGSCGWP